MTSERLAPEILRGLMARRNGPGLVRASVTIGTFALSGWAAMTLSVQGSAGAWIALLICGIALTGLFPLMHETGHGTAFESRLANTALNWIGALGMLQAPSFFREFHLAHHRWTQDPERDPEIAIAPGILEGWPGNPIIYLARLSGQHLWVGKFGFTAICALLPYPAWRRLFPFVEESNRRRVAWESRLCILVLAGGGALGLMAVPGFAFFLLAWPLAHLGLGIYLMAEHSGMAVRGTQFERTRSLLLHPALRWLMWNMPYHAEHHAYPAIPFHALPDLHERIDPEASNSLPSLFAFHRKAIRRSLGG